MIRLHVIPLSFGIVLQLVKLMNLLSQPALGPHDQDTKALMSFVLSNRLSGIFAYHILDNESKV